MYHNYFDSHVHTDNSSGGKHKITFLCEEAINKGMTGFAVTDSFSCDLPDPHLESSIRNSVLDVRRALVAFHRDLVITSGIELGQPLYNLEVCENILKACPYDFVLAALHRDREHPSFKELNFRNLSFQEIDQCLDGYYNEMVKMAKWGGFDVLAHLTFPLNQIEGVYQLPVNTDYYGDAIRQVLKFLAEQGKGLELNTSGLRTGYGKCMPEEKYLRWFKELGGEIVTIGSDAYEADQLGAGIFEGMELLEQIGFRYFAVYKERKPVMLDIL